MVSWWWSSALALFLLLTGGLLADWPATVSVMSEKKTWAIMRTTWAGQENAAKQFAVVSHRHQVLSFPSFFLLFFSVPNHFPPLHLIWFDLIRRAFELQWSAVDNASSVDEATVQLQFKVFRMHTIKSIQFNSIVCACAVHHSCRAVFPSVSLFWNK